MGIGAVVLVVAATIGAGFSDSLKGTAKSFADHIIVSLQNKYEELFPPKLPRAHNKFALTILVARLDEDADGSQTKHVSQSLHRTFNFTDGEPSVDLILTSRILRVGDTGIISHDYKAAEEIGRDWLKESGADVLVWGSVAERNKVLRLNFVANAKMGRKATESYKLTDILELPKDFDSRLGATIAEKVLSQVEVAYDAGNYSVPLLAALRPKLVALVSQQLFETARERCSLLLSTIVVGRRLGEQTGETSYLVEAVQFAQQIMNESHCMEDNETNASAHNDLGTVLLRLAERKHDSAQLERAISAFQSAGKIWTRERVPDLWASVEANRASALVRIGERENSRQRLKQAAVIYRQVLTVVSRTENPFFWAGVSQNLAVALKLIGAQERNGRQIKEAIDVFRDALKIRTRERVPMLWASTQVNLSDALIALGKIDRNQEHLEEAITKLRASLEERRRDRVPLQWARSQRGLAEALAALGELKGDASIVEKAIEVHEDALHIFKELGAKSDLETGNEEKGQAQALLQKLKRH